MSLEPKPRSMAAVTITVLRWNGCLSKIRLFAGISEYLQVLAQVTLGSNNPRSADNQQERPTRRPSRVGILRDHTPNS
jgi:hypothetical protein